MLVVRFILKALVHPLYIPHAICWGGIFFEENRK